MSRFLNRPDLYSVDAEELRNVLKPFVNASLEERKLMRMSKKMIATRGIEIAKTSQLLVAQAKTYFDLSDRFLMPAIEREILSLRENHFTNLVDFCDLFVFLFKFDVLVLY